MSRSHRDQIGRIPLFLYMVSLTESGPLNRVLLRPRLMIILAIECGGLSVSPESAASPRLPGP